MDSGSQTCAYQEIRLELHTKRQQTLSTIVYLKHLDSIVYFHFFCPANINAS